jgi:hypothetical protein
MKLPSIRQVYLEAKQAARRFPFVLFCALAIVFTALVLIETESERSVGFPIILAAALGIPLLAALKLCAEKRKWSAGVSTGAQLSGVLLLVGYAFTLPTSFENEPAGFFIRFGLLAAGLVLLVMIFPYLKKGELNGFWHYNRTLYFRLFVTAIFSVVLFAGLAIALAALDNLFGVSIPGKRYGELWVLVAGLFAPWFFLAGTPQDLDSLDRIEEYPKGLKIFAQYILLSLVTVYLAILYAYLLKILLQWNWPKGWVSSLILGFSAVSILSLLLMHPIRDRAENAWIRSAGKWLYIILIPLIAVLFLAVTERIGDYGITESRYAGIALGIWLSAQTLYFLFSRSKSIKFIIGSLCLLAFLMSFGPWGMLGVSQRSQVGRLSKLLTESGILVGGKVHKDRGKASHEDAQEINSIVLYLRSIHGYDAIQSWFADSLKENKKSGIAANLSPSDVLDKMGVPFSGYRGRLRNMDRQAFNLDSKKPVDISGFDCVLRSQTMAVKAKNSFSSSGISYETNESLEKMTVTIGKQGELDAISVVFDIAAFADKLMSRYGGAEYAIAGNMAPEAMSMEEKRNGRKVKLLFTHLSLERKSGKTAISSFTADIAYASQGRTTIKP